MTKHKWHKEIKAWADGAIIQFKDSNDIDEWTDCVDNEAYWGTGNNMQYRIKPQPKEPQYLYAYMTENGIDFGVVGQIHPVSNHSSKFEYIGKVKLEVDDD